MKRAREFLPAVLETSAESPERNQDWVFAFWEEAVGALVARRARPTVLQGRLLIVEVDGVDWIGQLEPLAWQLVRQINRSAGRRLVDRIAFRAARLARKPPAKALRSQPETDSALDPMRRRAYRASRQAQQAK